MRQMQSRKPGGLVLAMSVKEKGSLHRRRCMLTKRQRLVHNVISWGLFFFFGIILFLCQVHPIPETGISAHSHNENKHNGALRFPELIFNNSRRRRTLSSHPCSLAIFFLGLSWPTSWLLETDAANTNDVETLASEAPCCPLGHSQ